MNRYIQSQLCHICFIPSSRRHQDTGGQEVEKFILPTKVELLVTRPYESNVLFTDLTAQFYDFSQVRTLIARSNGARDLYSMSTSTFDELRRIIELIPQLKVLEIWFRLTME